MKDINEPLRDQIIAILDNGNRNKLSKSFWERHI